MSESVRIETCVDLIVMSQLRCCGNINVTSTFEAFIAEFILISDRDIVNRHVYKCVTVCNFLSVISAALAEFKLSTLSVIMGCCCWVLLRTPLGSAKV